MDPKRALAQAFRAAIPGRLDVLRAAHGGDAAAQKRARRIAHQIRGVAATCGFEDVGDLAGMVEHADGARFDPPLRALINELRRACRTNSTNGGVMIVHPKIAVREQLRARALEFTAEVVVANDLAMAHALLDAGDTHPSVVIAALDQADGSTLDLVDRIQTDPALDGVQALLIEVPPVDRANALSQGALECFSGHDGEELWESVSTLAGFELVGLELDEGDHRVAATVDDFDAAIRRAAEEYLLAQGPAWCLAAFRVTNAGHLRKAGGAAALRRAIELLSEALLERSGEDVIVGPIDDRTVGAVQFSHSAVALAFALDPVRRTLPNIKVRTGDQIKPLIVGCVVHAGTVGVPTVLKSVEEQLEASTPRDVTLKTMQMPDEPRNTVFVVEDDDVFATLAERAIESLGLRMVRASDARGAVERTRTFARTPFCMLLLDVSLPDMSGYDLLATLRTDPRLHDVPAVFVSALGTERQILEGLQKGADDYIVKPITEPVLAAKIRAALARGIRGSRSG